MKLIYMLIVLLPLAATAQTFKEKSLKTEIKEVTVFTQGAQLFESGAAMLSPGKTILKITGLSPYIDEKSIQVKADGNFTLLSVNHKLNYLSELKKDSKADSLTRLEESANRKVNQFNARLSVLAEKQSLLAANRSLSSPSSGVTVATLKQTIDFYDAELTRMKEEEIRIRENIIKENQQITSLKRELKELNDFRPSPTGEIELRVSAEASSTAKFMISYFVKNAGWYPKYDIRVTNIKQPLELVYKAEVYQNTGRDWNNVKLKFSNGDPNESGSAPDLKPWRLNYARYTIPGQIYGSSSVTQVAGVVLDEAGQPIPGVNVLVKGTSNGTSTDVNGRYSLTLPQAGSPIVFAFIGYSAQEVVPTSPVLNVRLAEDVMQLSETVVTGNALSGRLAGVQVRGYSSVRNKSEAEWVATSVIENQTTVEIEVNEPYSIKSNGEKLMIDLKKHSIEARYQYYAVPKLEKDAFLVAEIVKWDQYNLLEGEANLYYEDAFVGRTLLNTRSIKDTLSISLGRDKNIILGRARNDENSKQRALGVNRTESREYKILVRNKKNQPINIVITDQIPVSVNSDVVVENMQLSKGTLDDTTGIVTWKLDIPAQQQTEMILGYDVKYPRKEKVYLE